MLDKSGYGGERIVLLHPTDQLIYNAFITVVADAFRKVGLNIDEQMVDWGTVVQRRTSKEPVDKGGWSIFPAGAPGPEFVDPMLANTLRSPGAKAWFGWPDASEDRGGVRGVDRCAERGGEASAGGSLPGGGVRLRADDSAWAVSAAGGVAVERHRPAEGIGAGVLGRGQGLTQPTAPAPVPMHWRGIARSLCSRQWMLRAQTSSSRRTRRCRPASCLSCSFCARSAPTRSTMWTERAYQEDVLVRRFLGRSHMLLNAPEAIHHVLVDNHANYRRSPASIRILRPITGNGPAAQRGRGLAAAAPHHRAGAGPADDADAGSPHRRLRPRGVATSAPDRAAGRPARGDADLALDIAGRSMFSLEMRQRRRRCAGCSPNTPERYAQPHLFDMVLPPSVPTLRDWPAAVPAPLDGLMERSWQARAGAPPRMRRATCSTCCGRRAIPRPARASRPRSCATRSRR